MIFCSKVFVAALVSATALATGQLPTKELVPGLFESSLGLSIATDSEMPFSCNNITLFAPTFTNLVVDIPGFVLKTYLSCNAASLGPSTMAGSCKWVPQTFLGITYDRGIELLRHNIPQPDAFQVYVKTDSRTTSSGAEISTCLKHFLTCAL
jgi:hypothetical protein